MPAEKHTLTDARLHRYFDGDLGPEEAAEVRRLIDGDPALAAKLEGLREVREVVRESSSDASLSDAETADMWAKISAGISAERPESAPALRVVGGGLAADHRAPAAARGPRRRYVALGVLALAAAALLVWLRPGNPGPGPGPTLAEHTPEPTVPEPDPTTADLVARTEVLEVDFGANTGAIFAVEDENGDRYAVVWLADEKKNTAVE